MPPFLETILEPVSAWLVRTSWQAAVLVAIVAGVQLVFGRLLAPRWRYALWMLVVVRLLMPVLPASRWSVFNATTSWAPADVANHARVREAASDGRGDGTDHQDV